MTLLRMGNWLLCRLMKLPGRKLWLEMKVVRFNVELALLLVVIALLVRMGNLDLRSYLVSVKKGIMIIRGLVKIAINVRFCANLGNF